jgi:acyl-CoA thioesterase YciA
LRRRAPRRKTGRLDFSIAPGAALDRNRPSPRPKRRPHGSARRDAADTNANGDIFGGWVLSQMDQAGGIAGVERARGRVVTIAVEAMTIIRPAKVGDVLCVYTEVVKVGRTSMKIHIEAWARRFSSHGREKVTDAVFTFVAVDEAGRPRAVPPPEPLTAGPTT